MIVSITSELISETTGYEADAFVQLQALDLHLRDDQRGKIRKIENLSLVPNLRQLNLSYNVIARIEGLDRLIYLVELNLAENAIQKIENLDNLKSLEKLNLSGNQIQRIPSSIRNLVQLTHLRLARNNLSQVEDVQHLGRLTQLSNLRIDENPFCRNTDYDLFAIFAIPSLYNLNGKEITLEKRQLSRQKFAKTQLEILQSQLVTERHRLSRLKRELQQPSSSPSRSGGNNQDESNRLLSIRLEEIGQVEKEIFRLQELIDHHTTTADYAKEARESSESEDFDRLQNNVGTPSMSQSLPRTLPRSASAPKLRPTTTTNMTETASRLRSSPERNRDNLAGKQISELTDRVGHLAMKVLTTEKEKITLKKELDSHKKSSSLIGQLQQELVQSDMTLEKALISAKNANDDLTMAMREVDTLRQTIRTKDEQVRLLKDENESLKSENEELRRELNQVSQLLEEKDTLFKKYPLPSALQGTDDAHRGSTIMTQKMNIDELQTLNHRLQSELDRYLQQANTLNHDLLRSLDENEYLKKRNVQLEMTLKEVQQGQQGKEQSQQVLVNEKIALERKIVALQTNIATLEADMQALIRAKRGSNSGSVTFTPRRNANVKSSSSAYRTAFKRRGLDALSTDSDEVDGNTEHKSSKTRFTPSKFAVSELDRSAAEIMAHIMLEELKFRKNNHNEHDLKEACIRAALRLVYTSSTLAQEDGEGTNELQEYFLRDESQHPHTPRGTKTNMTQKIAATPFHALGDRDFLSKLVTETHAGLTAMEESELLREEVIQLEKLARELEIKVTVIDQTIIEKEQAVKGLEKHAVEAKQQAEATLHELENLHKKLQTGRDEFMRIDAEHTLLKREVEISRHHLRDSAALSEIETRNLATLRDRVTELKREQMDLDTSLITLKEMNLKEESKLRNTKAITNDQLRILQTDLTKLTHDLRAKQRLTEETEKHRRSLEEESDLRKRELDSYLTTTTLQVEDELRKLTNTKNENRFLKLEIENLTSKRKQVDSDLLHLTEKYSTEISKFENEDIEVKRRLEGYDRQILDAERKAKVARDQVQLLENESVMLRQSVDELRRQQVEIERNFDTRRRTSESEVTQSQSQAQLAIRTLRQTQSQIEQKGSELQSLLTEIRSAERKNDDLKRQIRDFESKMDTSQDTVKTLENEKEKLLKDVQQMKREEEESRQFQLTIKSTIDSETRLLEDIRRRVVLLTTEETSLKESESRLRTTLSSLRKSLDETQTDLETTRSLTDRERRGLTELNTKKTLVESDILRLQETLKCIQERQTDEHFRTSEVEQTLLKSIDEMNRGQKAFVLLEKKLEDCRRKEQEMIVKTQQTRQNYQKLLLEMEGLSSLHQNEKHVVSTLQREIHDVSLLKQRQQDELQLLQSQLQERRNEVEGLKLQSSHYDQVKISLEKEVQRLQDASKVELKRIEALEVTYSSVDLRLKSLRDELLKLESTHAEAKHRTAEEERKAEQQRRLLHESIDEMREVEKSMQQARQQLEVDKRSAIGELSRLELARQDAQQQIYRMAETQRVLETRSPLAIAPPPPSSSSASSASSFQAMRATSPAVLSNAAAAVRRSSTGNATMTSRSTAVALDEANELIRRGRANVSANNRSSLSGSSSRGASSSTSQRQQQQTGQGDEESDHDDDSLGGGGDERKQSSSSSNAGGSGSGGGLSSLQRAVQTLRKQSDAVMTSSSAYHY